MNTPELVLAGILALVAAAIWLVFLRPAPRVSARGVIAAKTFRPASTYRQQPIGNRGGFWGSTPIPIAEGYVFRIRVEGRAAELRYTLNTQAAAAFAVGQPVRVEYEERGVPRIWGMDLVFRMTPDP
jgi:hypothetical protein